MDHDRRVERGDREAGRDGEGTSAPSLSSRKPSPAVLPH